MGVLKNDLYQINVAKAEFRAAYNSGSVDRLLAVFADEFTDMSAGVPSFFGAGASAVFRSRMTKLFQQYRVSVVVTIIAIRIFDDIAFDYGWHTLTLESKDGGKSIITRKRYCETWQRNSRGEWKIDFYIDNMEAVPAMPDAELPFPEVVCCSDAATRRHNVFSSSETS
jgi:ketosteroid isomerase-like protein